jgi:hypothetical protein
MIGYSLNSSEVRVRAKIVIKAKVVLGAKVIMRTKVSKIKVELTHKAAREGTPKTSIHKPPHSKHTDRIVAAVLIVIKLNDIIKGILFIPSLIWISFRNKTHQIRIKPPKQQ